MANSPIADLSYRGYEGPLSPPSRRWLVIARMGMRLAFHRRAYWVLTGLSGWYFGIMIVVVYMIEQFALHAGPAGDNMRQMLTSIRWNAEFVHGFSLGQIFFLVIALNLGAGAIANDNRANALLVYLSKPCTKRDYLVGKWFGLWIPLLVAMAAPAAVFLLYGAMNYREYSFFADRWMILRMLGLYATAAAFHASLILGVSSLVKQGRVAGAVYAGLYFLSNFFTILIAGIIGTGSLATAVGAAKTLIVTLYYCSIDGVLIGMSKLFMNTDGTNPFVIQGPSTHVPRPPILFVVLVVGLLSSGAVLVAWSRVKAVEVVK